MRIGLPREIKPQENRVGITPLAVQNLCKKGHSLLVEKNAGLGSGFSDAEYIQAGAKVIESHDAIYHESDMVVKVKEPLPSEYPLMRKGLVIFTYFHLAANKPLAEAMVQSGVTGISYDTLQVNGMLPLLRPMSEIAGRMAPLVGAHCMAKHQGGTGVLLTGVPGVIPGKVLVLGGGVSGYNAARIAAGMGAEVAVMERSAERVRWLDDALPNARIIHSNDYIPQSYLENADLIIGAVLIPGARAPRLISRDQLKFMKPGCVLLDIAIDQGGCMETSRATTHENPTYIEEGVIHYCVANMPGAYAKTATIALTNATYAYVDLLANHGVAGACKVQPSMMSGINVLEGKVAHPEVAAAHNMPCVPVNF